MNKNLLFERNSTCIDFKPRRSVIKSSTPTHSVSKTELRCYRYGEIDCLTSKHNMSRHKQSCSLIY